MSVFGSIVSAIFGSKHAAGVTPAATPSLSAPSSTGTTASSSSPSSTGAAAPSATPAAAAAAKPISRADVEAILQKLAADVREDLDWRKSIVDLMKLLTHPIHERLRLNQTERVDIATSTFPGTSVMWHTRFWKAAEDGLFMTTVNKTG